LLIFGPFEAKARFQAMNDTKSPVRPGRLFAIAAVLGVLAGAGAIYMTSMGARNESATLCSTDRTVTGRMKPLAKGEVAAVLVPEQPRKLPALGFRDGTGKEVSLKDFAGKTLLLNLWATWCAPCRQEMPALDALQREFGGPDFEIAAVSIDTQDPDKAREFLKELNIAKLGFYADPSGKLFQDLKLAGRAVGLPTSILIDKAGCEIGYLPGPADWASEDAKALIRAALGR
jgi:thiol-disulfide isomerase/thioredoxin